MIVTFAILFILLLSLRTLDATVVNEISVSDETISLPHVSNALIDLFKLGDICWTDRGEC
jgi:hypothetical protein